MLEGGYLLILAPDTLTSWFWETAISLKSTSLNMCTLQVTALLKLGSLTSEDLGLFENVKSETCWINSQTPLRLDCTFVNK